MSNGQGRGKLLKRAGLVILMGACAMLMSASQAKAVIIDHFEDIFVPDVGSQHGNPLQNTLWVNNTWTEDCSTQTGLGVLGQDRLAKLDWVAGTGSIAATSQVLLGPHFLKYSNSATNTSTLDLLYDGDVGAAGSGLGNLAAGGAQSIIIDLLYTDINASITVTVTDCQTIPVTQSATIVVLTAVTSPMPMVFDFTLFPGVDFTKIKKLDVLLTNVSSSSSVDFEIDAIETGTVPEPLTMLGMVFGLGSVGAYIRKRRMA